MLLNVERELISEDGAEEVAVDVIKVYDGSPTLSNLILVQSIDLDLVAHLESVAVAARAVYERQRLRDQVLDRHLSITKQTERITK